VRTSSVSLKDFRAYGSATLAPNAPIALVFAKNFTGKTTLRDAFSILLTGKMENQGGGGLTFERMVRHGERVAILDAIFPAALNGKDVQIRRHISTKGLETRVLLGGVSAGKGDEIIASLLSPAIADILVNGAGFFSWTPKDQKAALLSLVSREIPTEMQKRFEGLMPQHRPAWLTVPTTLDEAQALLPSLEDERRAAKRRRESLRQSTAPSEPTPPIAEMEQKLTGLRARRVEIAAAGGEARGEARALRANIENLETEIARLKQTADSSCGDALSRALDAHEAAKQALADWSAKSVACDDIEKELGALTARIFTLAAKRDQCVWSTPEAEIACPLTVGRKQAIRNADDTRRKELERLLASKRRALGQKPNIAPQRDAVRDAEKRVADERARSERLAITETARSIGVKRLESATGDGDASAAEDAELEARIKSGEGLIRKAREIEAEWVKHNAAMASIREAEADIITWDALAKEVGPNGIQAGLIAERIGGFQASVNGVCEDFGFSFGITPEPWEIVVGGAHPRLMAESQRLMAGFALQLAVATITRTRFVFIDGIDKLDKRNREVLFEALIGALNAQQIQQAILTATYVDDAALTREWPRVIEPWLAERTDKGTTLRRL
jgi:hypothetical protein